MTSIKYSLSWTLCFRILINDWTAGHYKRGFAVMLLRCSTKCVFGALQQQSWSPGVKCSSFNLLASLDFPLSNWAEPDQLLQSTYETSFVSYVQRSLYCCSSRSYISNKIYELSLLAGRRLALARTLAHVHKSDGERRQDWVKERKIRLKWHMRGYNVGTYMTMTRYCSSPGTTTTRDRKSVV